MKFLKQIANEFYRSEGDELCKYCFIFPNRRAGLFFKKYLGEIAERPLFSPGIMTINDLFVRLSGMVCADKTDLLVRLYKIYCEHSSVKESFDEFIYWGEILLNDFDDVDKYLANPKMLFANIRDLKNIENDYSFLTTAQIEAVKGFWNNFLPVGDSEKKLKFKSVWDILLPVYENLNSDLERDQKGYEGMIFRKVASSVQKDSDILVPLLNDYKEIVFVGLNALNNCERVLMKALANRGVADFYWDYSGEYVRDESNRASAFMKLNCDTFPSKRSIKREIEGNPVFEVIGVPSSVAQASVVAEILQKCGGGIESAVVLPDESMLMPVLYSVPKDESGINVTMGYPLKSTAVASLVNMLINFQKGGFYHRSMMPLLKNNYISSLSPDFVKSLISLITAGNYIYIPQAEVVKDELMATIFRRLEFDRTGVVDVKMVTSYIREVLELIVEKGNLSPVEREFFYYMMTSLKRVEELVMPVKLDTFGRLLSQIISSSSIPFRGEPLAGLQIMGVLETRALDFENVIFCSMNEGVYPVKSAPNSFIPYNLRRGFDLPSYEYMDAVLAYNFYRSISRAKKVWLLYDTRSEGLRSGEVSRFVNQLKYHYHANITERACSYKIEREDNSLKMIEKDDAVWSLINERYLSGGRPFSASALNTYIDCGIKFYFRYVLGIEEERELSEGVEANTFGSIFHEAAHKIYSPLRNQSLSKDNYSVIVKRKEEINRIVEESFLKILRIDEIRGHNLLVKDLIVKYINILLAYDSSLAPVVVKETEKRIELEYEIGEGAKVKLKAIIDRIDEVFGALRVVDYKTGGSMVAIKSQEELFVPKRKKGANTLFQLLFYALVLRMEGVLVEKVAPYMLKELSSAVDKALDIDSASLDEFSERLSSLIKEIISKERPFSRAADEKMCEKCEFKIICK